ncbi:MAG: hypothetical protein KKH01_00130 [Firmicutes bacterium]|nr:hypothetical protein [Bacillota bacterium]
MRKFLVIALICVVSLAVSVSFSLGQTNRSSDLTLDFANSGTPEVVELDFANSGTPEVVELGFHNSDLPTHVEF